MERDKTIARDQILGNKKRKTRFTFTTCANETGTKKFEPKIIEKAKKRLFLGLASVLSFYLISILIRGVG